MASTTTDGSPAPFAADSPLLRGLLDDAALFPPAALPPDQALAAHRAHRASSHAAAVGPFLVAASGVADLVAALDDEPSTDAGRDVLDVAVVARPGSDPATLGAAREALRQDPRVRVAGVELGWYEGWYDDWAGELPVAVEAPRGPEGDRAFAEARTAHREGFEVVLKLRTGPTPTWPWPDEEELADFIGVAAREVPFKLTGGLHHAVRGTYEVGGVAEENHGVLNVLLATSAALSGASRNELAALLGLRDAPALAALVASWPDETARAVRGALVSYGCCTVTDPLGELADLGLVHHP